MSPEIQYDQVERQTDLKHPSRRGRAPLVTNFLHPQFTPKTAEEEKELAQVRDKLAKIQQHELQQSQERFALGLALQFFLTAAVPHIMFIPILTSFTQEIASSVLDEPGGDDVDKAVLRGAIGQGVSSVTGVG